MRFADSVWLLGALLAVVVAVLLIIGGFKHLRAIRRFGDEKEVQNLITRPAGARRALEGVCLVLAVALGFAAMAKPQYGKGTRLIPATNLDVVLVLDYSKSMYARDVAPSRTERAVSEVGRVIQELPGARFGAVAFAGQPMSFPLTSDGAAIAQFFRGLSPNDMPVGGTAIARALHAARELLERDPLSKKHERVIVLVTDGEDLEGDPVAMAEAAAQAGITIHVVQVGGRTPEPIPDVDQRGRVTGWRTSQDGSPLTTSLSAEGEAQLAKIAEVTGGTVVRSARGALGIDEVKARLKRMMSEELSEKVETVYADVYWIPLSVALGLLGLEALLIGIWGLRLWTLDRRRRAESQLKPPRPRKRRKLLTKKAKRAGATAAATIALLVVANTGCEGKVSDLFQRHSPSVDDAIASLDAGDSEKAVELLEQYLATGKCEEGAIGAPPSVSNKHNAGFDLGLGLFKLGEKFGKRFGDEEPEGDAGASPEQQAELANRSEQVDCALRIVQMIAADASVPLDLRARAYYLAGNLSFLRRDYRSAVTSYDQALKLSPGFPEGPRDHIGNDAAYNRAIALRRIEEQPPDAEPDADQDASPDAEPDAEPDAGNDAEPDAGPDAEPDAGQDGSSGQDAEPDGSDDQKNKDGQDDAGPPDAGNDAAPQPQPQRGSANQDERMLDMLEQAPSFQEERAKEATRPSVGGGMEDK